MGLSIRALSDQDLLGQFAEIVNRDRATNYHLIAYINEIDLRRLFAPAGFSSMHAFCVARFGFSEDMAAKRIRVARKSRRFPGLLKAIADGRLHLYGAYLLGPHLT